MDRTVLDENKHRIIRRNRRGSLTLQRSLSERLTRTTSETQLPGLEKKLRGQ